MSESRVTRYLPFTVLPIAVFSVHAYTIVKFGNTFTWWLVQILIVLFFFWESRYSSKAVTDTKKLFWVKLLLLWNMFSVMRGFFVAEDYWQYKSLIGMGITLFMPLLVYTVINPIKVQSILSFYVKYALPFGLLLLGLISRKTLGAIGWYLFPISFLLIFLPALSIRVRVLLLLITLSFLVVDQFGGRSFVIKFGLPVFWAVLPYKLLNPLILRRIFGFSQKLFMFMPILFILLAITNVFNVLQIGEYVSGNYVSERKDRDGKVYDEDLLADSRTFLYHEVIKTSVKYNSYIIGRTPARGSETEWFAEEMIRYYGYPERFRNEVGVLNVYMWTGIIGVMLHFLVYYSASMYAIRKSKNIYAKLIGIFVAFRWTYFWIEDYQAFDLNNFVLWMMVGICFSSNFLNMTNEEVKLWIGGVFDKDYRLSYKKYVSSKSADIQIFEK